MDNTEYESNWAKACRARGLVSPYVYDLTKVHGEKANGNRLLRSSCDIRTMAV
jgi:hypothetical protein